MITILLYNDTWGVPPKAKPECSSPYRIVRDRQALCAADIVVFHIPALHESLPAHKPPGQLWVAWSMESRANYPCLNDPGFMRRFDLTWAYWRDADIWAPYFGPETGRHILAAPQAKREPAPAVYLASSPFDRSGRTMLACELMRHIAIDSWGRQLNNRRLVADQGRSTKLALIARYRFTLAFENSIDDDYVTEKFFDPLIAGSVPVYLGAPNIAAYAPAENCFIDVRDFRTPALLADYLRFLAASPAEYERYLSWRQNGLSRTFEALIQRIPQDPWRRMAALAARRAVCDGRPVTVTQ